MCDYTKDIKFIEKRKYEQINYIVEVGQRHFEELISFDRYKELVTSANNQLGYFNGLIKEYYEPENKLPTIQK